MLNSTGNGKGRHFVFSQPIEPTVRARVQHLSNHRFLFRLNIKMLQLYEAQQYKKHLSKIVKDRVLFGMVWNGATDDRVNATVQQQSVVYRGQSDVGLKTDNQ